MLVDKKQRYVNEQLFAITEPMFGALCELRHTILLRIAKDNFPQGPSKEASQ
jgi:hypothetical protein